MMMMIAHGMSVIVRRKRKALMGRTHTVLPLRGGGGLCNGGALGGLVPEFTNRYPSTHQLSNESDHGLVPVSINITKGHTQNSHYLLMGHQ